ncbi:Mediator of RNA polymerase II transcription subunit 6 [Podila clonocystis]|nr:Mediator of RNA polymerase II transcription subunit 6 [Podila clonocystis]
MAAAGATGGSEAKVDLMNIEWRFQEWLIGMGGLNPENVLDYFALSPFWDPECNNAVLRMQTQFNNLGEMKQRLSEMIGVEFALVLDRYPHLFVIQKQRRKNPQEESVDFRNAVERAIISTDKKLRDQKEQTTGNLGANGSMTPSAAGSAAAAAGSKVKTEPGTPASGSSTPAGKGTAAAKTAAKRRKKSEDPSMAAANINTSAAMTGGRPVGGGPATPATPTAATPTKRRKKTKTSDTK